MRQICHDGGSREVLIFGASSVKRYFQDVVGSEINLLPVTQRERHNSSVGKRFALLPAKLVVPRIY